jgi:ribosome small subunit-dependent GTPase A
VGKSSLINALCESLELETGGMSKKTARGRHTTRASTLLKLEKTSGYVLDTPGFSLLELDQLPQEDVQLYYPEMKPFCGECRFANCLHIAEPGCAIKQAVKNGEISNERYERYKVLCQEQQEKEKKKYR